jgi:tetratricopeptide (TPR) repeat protein
MDPSRWSRVEAIFHDTAERSPAEREAYLRQACGDDESLLREVRRLLDADARGAGDLHSAIGMEAARLVQQASATRWIGRRIASWCVTSVIGEGGGGTVLAAVRDDGRFEQTVAIKVLRLEARDSGQLARLRRERRLLAQLEHPHIARLLDGGEVSFGDDEIDVPYLVMEFVEGQPITTYYRAARAGIADRLAGFLQVLDSVAYAHRRLVLHRDLKPANILVTAAGQAKLLDFGVAQLLTDGADDPDRDAQAVGLTPAYASPEQLAGRSLSVESDVYSLGVVLFELLADRHPYATDASTTVDLVRAADGSAPAPLGIAADLDAIVARAMHRDAARRYRSVEAFADDVGRYLAGRPVAARPSTIWYRSRKFVGRHRWETAATLILVAALAAGVAGTAYEAHRANRRVQELRQLAGSLLFQVHDAIESLPGSTEARELLVRTSAEHLDRLAEDAGTDRALLLDMAASYERLAKLQGGPSAGHIGKPADAIVSYGKALAIYRRVLAAQPDERDALMRMAMCWKNLGRVQELSGDATTAASSLQQALSAGERAARFDAQPPVELLDTYSTLGDLEVDVGEPARALDHYRKALAGFEQRAAETPDLKSIHSVVTATVRLGQAQTYLGALEEARTAFERALAAARPLAERNPNSMPARRDVLIITDRLAEVLGDPDTPNLGRWQAAAALFEAALPGAVAMQEADTHDARAARDVAEFHGNLADCLRDHEPARAIPEYEAALKAYAALPESYRKTPNIVRFQAARERGLGLALANAGEDARAVALVRHALELFDGLAESDTHPGGRQDSGATLRSLGVLEGRMGDRQAGARHLEQAVQLLQAALHEHGGDVSVRQDLSDAYLGLAVVKAADGDCRASSENVALAAALWRDLERVEGAATLARAQLSALEGRPACEPHTR